MIGRLLGLLGLSAKPTKPYHWKGDGSFDLPVVGESFRKSDIARVVEGRGGRRDGLVARLVPEDDNPHDANAVAVFIDGIQVGYLSRENAVRYRAAADRLGVRGPSTCSARIRGGGSRHFGVRLDAVEVSSQ